MIAITTKRHFLKSYVLITLGFLLFIAMGLISGYSFFEMYNNGRLVSKNYILLFLCPGSLFMAFYTIIRYLKNTPIITVDLSGIKFNDEAFIWTNLDKIELTGKKPYKYIINFPMEGTMFQFKDGRVKYLYDDMYENSWQLKSFIQQVIINKQDNAEIHIKQVEKNEIQNEVFEIFRGNQFTSLRGISLWGMIGFLLFLLLSNKKSPPTGLIIFFGIIGTFWFIIHSYLMYYIALSDKYFVVRNHNFIWINKVFRVDDIKEVVFESKGNMPNCLRVITKDFRNKLYPAGTLRDKLWLNLKDKLELKGILVRNECI
jgi:hypothetical protein